MPPFRGQGANHALQDCHNFVEAVKEIAAAPSGEKSQLQARLIQDYSDEVAKRGAEETFLSTKNGKMALAYTDFKESPYMKQGLSKT
jgi:2-polyprenyl-6-methoxyphenol hydroxylase-like FAD-dependent oxidoreductase